MTDLIYDSILYLAPHPLLIVSAVKVAVKRLKLSAEAHAHKVINQWFTRARKLSWFNTVWNEVWKVSECVLCAKKQLVTAVH